MSIPSLNFNSKYWCASLLNQVCHMFTVRMLCVLKLWMFHSGKEWSLLHGIFPSLPFRSNTISLPPTSLIIGSLAHLHWNIGKCNCITTKHVHCLDISLAAARKHIIIRLIEENWLKSRKVVFGLFAAFHYPQNVARNP